MPSDFNVTSDQRAALQRLLGTYKSALGAVSFEEFTPANALAKMPTLGRVEHWCEIADCTQPDDWVLKTPAAVATNASLSILDGIISVCI